MPPCNRLTHPTCGARIRPLLLASTLATLGVSSLGAEEPPEVSAKRTFHVESAEELLSAIGPDRSLHLAAGRYRLSDLEPVSTEHVRWRQVHDGLAVEIHDLAGLEIVGPESGVARIEVAPRYADVLVFERVEDVRLERLELAHAEGSGTCTGGVLRFDDASRIEVVETVLHGSGIEGLTLRNVRGGMFAGNEIRGTTERLLSARNSTDLRFENNRFFERQRGVAILEFINTSGVELVGDRLAARLTAESRVADFFRLDSRSSLELDGFHLQDRVTGASKIHHETLASSRRDGNTDRDLLRGRVRFEEIGGEEERVTLDLPGIGEFTVGTVTRVPGAVSHYGVDPESIVARRLGGEGDPILIAWSDYAQGMGNYQSVFYIVARPQGPPTRLLEGELGVSGKSGWADHGRAEVSFGFRDGVLERRVERYEWRATDERRPLARREEIGANWYWVAEIEKVLIDRWRFEDGRLVPLDSRTFYRLGPEDPVEGVARYFDVEPGRLRHHEPWRAGAWVEIVP